MDKMAVVSKERRAAGTLTQQHSCHLGDSDAAVAKGNDPGCRTKHPPYNPRSSREERQIACVLYVSHEAFKVLSSQAYHKLEFYSSNKICLVSNWKYLQ